MTTSFKKEVGTKTKNKYGWSSNKKRTNFKRDRKNVDRMLRDIVRRGEYIDDDS